MEIASPQRKQPRESTQIQTRFWSRELCCLLQLAENNVVVLCSPFPNPHHIYLAPFRN